MEKDIKVSVLIPVYGVEKYIEKCARSLFEQTMQEGIEFIFTDDCSKDRSIDVVKEVLKEYPNRHSQVRFLRHKENMGLAEARVTGLKAARGEYVIHCDSDDWVAKEMYESMYEEAIRINADVVGCDAIHVYPNISLYRREAFLLPKKKLIKELLLGRKIEGYLWNRLIKKDFYEQGHFRAKKGTTLFEDMAVTVPLHALVQKIGYVKKPLYYYRKTDSFSMSAETTDSNILSAYSVLRSLYQNPALTQWKGLIMKRVKVFLFSRLFSKDYIKIRKWNNLEYNIIKNDNIPLSKLEKFRILLAKNSHNKLQFYLYYFSRIIRPGVWFNHIFKINGKYSHSVRLD